VGVDVAGDGLSGYSVGVSEDAFRRPLWFEQQRPCEMLPSLNLISDGVPLDQEAPV
jgi:hypothetical protein